MYTRVIMVKNYGNGRYLFMRSEYPFKGSTLEPHRSYQTGDIEAAKLAAFGISGHDDGEIIWKCDE